MRTMKSPAGRSRSRSRPANQAGEPAFGRHALGELDTLRRAAAWRRDRRRRRDRERAGGRSAIAGADGESVDGARVGVADDAAPVEDEAGVGQAHRRRPGRRPRGDRQPTGARRAATRGAARPAAAAATSTTSTGEERHGGRAARQGRPEPGRRSRTATAAISQRLSDSLAATRARTGPLSCPAGLAATIADGLRPAGRRRRPRTKSSELRPWCPVDRPGI